LSFLYLFKIVRLLTHSFQTELPALFYRPPCGDFFVLTLVEQIVCHNIYFFYFLYFIIISIIYKRSAVFRASVPALRKPEESDESHHLLLIFITSLPHTFQDALFNQWPERGPQLFFGARFKLPAIPGFIFALLRYGRRQRK
jgi:hypothetical protein